MISASVKLKIAIVIALVLMGCGAALTSSAQENALPARIDKEVLELMDDGDIPGLSLVVIDQGKQVVKSFGYADAESKRPVNPHTLFELGSCSKAFTAMAVLKLAANGAIDLNAPVTNYIPWLQVKFKDSLVSITVRQLLHHTSGIPWQTIAGIPEGAGPDALEKTVRKLSGIHLNHPPGKLFEYATVNYDILALIVEKVTGQVFEAYLQSNILDDLGLSNTTIGIPSDSSLMSSGYRISFFRARRYKAPVYKGNNAAGYVISNGEDVARWVRFQMGLSGHPLYGIALATQQRDETVPLQGMSSYAMGWFVSLSGNGEIYHDGLNPNYTSYIAFRTGKGIGVAVLANSNSNYTALIAKRVMKLLAGEERGKEWAPGDRNDSVFSALSFGFGVCLLALVTFLVTVIIAIIKKKRKYDGISGTKQKKIGVVTLLVLPFLYGIYILPEVIAGFTWATVVVWTPMSFTTLIVLILLCVGVGYITYVLTLLFPGSNKLRGAVPQVIVVSILSGVANMAVIALVTSSLESGIAIKYLLFYYGLVVAIYLLGRKFVQVAMIRLTNDVTYDLKMKLMNRIFSTSYRNFEKIDSGRIYTALNDDVETIGVSANMAVGLITSMFTVLAAFLYLISIALWATLLTFSLIGAISVIYFLVSKSTERYFEEARDTRSVFMSLVSSLISGFKEISMHRRKRAEYKADVAQVVNEYREKLSTANIRFANAFMIGESLLVLLLGAVVFAIPEIFQNVRSNTIMGFVVVLLYLIGPVNAILTAVPALVRLRVAWARIRKFLNEIPESTEIHAPANVAGNQVESFRAVGVKFKYNESEQQNCFEVGPIDIEARRGEIIFIIGGNGSGKTTLAKLITGLYDPDEGQLMINNEAVRGAQLSEYYSAVFGTAHIFKKVYNIDMRQKSVEIARYLKMLHLDKKVRIADAEYSTIDLSSGQKKRLALLQCYLEDAPIYLFDEWAADQDPDYRNVFYRTLLPEMKRAGKIVIAITHDDHYFDVADKIYKMNFGKLDVCSRQSLFTIG